MCISKTFLSLDLSSSFLFFYESWICPVTFDIWRLMLIQWLANDSHLVYVFLFVVWSVCLLCHQFEGGLLCWGTARLLSISES